MKSKHSHCAFCKKNGETPTYYTSHKLKDENDNITCPVLLEYTCPKCNIKGSHTASYCNLDSTREKPASTPARKPLQVQSNKSTSLARNNKINNLNNIKLNINAGQQSSPLMSVPSIDPPSICKPGGSLTGEQLDWLLQVVNSLPIEQRVCFLLKNDYNPARLDFVRQLAYQAECFLMYCCT